MPFHVETLAGVAALRQIAARWDALQERSDALPVARAAPLAGWLEQFAPRASFRAVVVREGDDLRAALPLYGRRWRRVFPVGDLPNNEWTCAGELVLDRAASDAVLDLLVAGLLRLPWSLLWLSGLDLDAPHWRRFREALTRARLPHAAHARFHVARVAVPTDWEAYFAARSKNHRRYVRRHTKALEQAGGGRLRLLDRLTPDEAETMLQSALAIEDAGWKGAAGSSIVRAPGMRGFFTQQARDLAACGALRLAFLDHAATGQPMAFAYGFASQAVFGLSKIGYDPEFEELSPGQMLLDQLLRHLSRAAPGTTVDFLGPLNEGLARWRTDEYTVGRLCVGLRGPISRAIVAALARRQPVTRAAPAGDPE